MSPRSPLVRSLRSKKVNGVRNEMRVARKNDVSIRQNIGMNLKISIAMRNERKTTHIIDRAQVIKKETDIPTEARGSDALTESEKNKDSRWNALHENRPEEAVDHWNAKQRRKKSNGRKSSWSVNKRNKVRLDIIS